jgi:hypothetical protein
MNEPKFTPGPWHVDGKYVVCGKEALKDAIFGNEPSICSICNVNGWLKHAEGNAALIAAAPEMYSRLEQCADDYDAMGMFENRNRIWELLAKARGEGGN